MGLEVMVRLCQEKRGNGVGEMESSGIRVSVAMAAYNGASYLQPQIDSILSQLGECDELVVSDDGSADGTLSILRAYQEKDSRVILIDGPRKGIKKNVENAVSHARGRYIFLADQDDIWREDKVQKALAAFEAQDAYVVIHDAQVFEESDSHTGSHEGCQVIMDSFFQFRNSGPGVIKNMWKNCYIGCCMAFRRELKEVILPIPGRIEMHDQWIGILGDYFCGKSCFLQEPLLEYRRHRDNNSSLNHYGIGKMLRNRIVFFGYFFVRILHFRHKKIRDSWKFQEK